MIRNRFKLSSIISKFFALIFIIGLTHVGNAASLDPSPIVNGISSICPMGIGNVAGIPGPIEIFSSSATGPVPIVSGDEDANPSFAVVGVASTSGNGRIVALGHDGFFINFAMSLQDFDNEKFGIKIINWLQNSQSNKKVLITTGHGEPWVGGSDYEDFRNTLEAQGYDVVITPGKITSDTLSAASGTSILLISCAGPLLTDEEIGYIRSFVTRGGGLFLQGLGWSWVQYQHLPLEDCPMNKLAKPYGFRWIDGYISDSQHNYNEAPIFSFFYPNRGKLLNVPFFYQGGTNWCWANSLAMMLQFFGEGDHAWDVASQLQAGRLDGLYEWDPIGGSKLHNYFSSKNLVLNDESSLITNKNYVFERILNGIDWLNTPVGMSFDTSKLFQRHWIVVIGYKIENNIKYIYYLDPAASFTEKTPTIARIPNPFDDAFYESHKNSIKLWYVTGRLTHKASPNPPRAVMSIVDGDNMKIESGKGPNFVHKVENGGAQEIDSYIILDKGINYRTREVHFPGFSRIDERTNHNMLRFYESQIGNWKDSKTFMINSNSIYVSNPLQNEFEGTIKILLRINDKTLPITNIETGVIPRENYQKIPDNNNIIIDLSTVTLPGVASIEFILLDKSNQQVDKIGPIDFEIELPNPNLLELEIKSPVDPIVTDPDGLTISRQSNEIIGATYVEVDANGEDDKVGIVSIPNKKSGIYKITVVSKPNADQEANYTLTIYSNDKLINLAKNIKIKNIPNNPYSIEVTDNEVVLPITIDKTGLPNRAAPGALINFTINITNTGTVQLNHVQVMDNLPDGLSYISDNRSGSLSERNVTWNDLPSLDIGESIFINLVARIDPNASGNLTNLAEATGIRATKKQEEVSNSGYSTVRVVDVKEPKVRQNVEHAKIGDQVAMATGNGRATNNIKVVSD